jgi:hypothetical protein
MHCYTSLECKQTQAKETFISRDWKGVKFTAQTSNDNISGQGASLCILEPNQAKCKFNEN